MTLPICTGCGGLGVSLGDERFCAGCLETIRAQADIGLAFLYEFMAHDARYREWCAANGVAA